VGDVNANSLLRKFEAMSVFRQTTLMVLLALIGADSLTALFYSIFFSDRFLLDIVLCSIIVIILGYPLGLFFIGQNVKLRKMAVELDRAARIDDLTGLYNRRTFFRECEESGADKGSGAFLYIDADHFKQLNDRFGHAAGDGVLSRLGVAIASCLRERDLAVRLGGEEFGIFLADTDLPTALVIAERIRRKSSRIRVGNGETSFVATVSIGIAVREQGQSLQELMTRADENLYVAKQQGRDRVVSSGSRVNAA